MRVTSKQDIGVKATGIRAGNLRRTDNVWRFQSDHNDGTRYIEVLKDSDARRIFGKETLAKVEKEAEDEAREAAEEAAEAAEEARKGAERAAAEKAAAQKAAADAKAAADKKGGKG